MSLNAITRHPKDSEVVPSSPGAELAAAAGRRRHGRSRDGADSGSAARAAERRDAAVPGGGAGGADRGAPGCAGLPAAGPDCGGCGGLRVAGAAPLCRLLSDLVPLSPPALNFCWSKWIF